jgi:hypothetical protein
MSIITTITPRLSLWSWRYGGGLTSSVVAARGFFSSSSSSSSSSRYRTILPWMRTTGRWMRTDGSNSSNSRRCYSSTTITSSSATAATTSRWNRSVSRICTNGSRLLMKRFYVNPATSPRNPINADAGPLATRIYHSLTTSLLFLSPLYCIMPMSWSRDTILGKTFEMMVATMITVHSWIGLNYVATDYVPKISKALLLPARYMTAGMSVITLFGLYRIILFGGGIKHVITELWNREPKRNIFDY